jgi:hypothetical protein
VSTEQEITGLVFGHDRFCETQPAVPGKGMPLTEVVPLPRIYVVNPVHDLDGEVLSDHRSLSPSGK